MGKVIKFEDLECWKNAKLIVLKIYLISDKGPLQKDYGLKDQLRRAATSIMNNIAEGFGRIGNRDFIRFLNYANSSANEVKSMLYLLNELNLITSKENENLHELTDTVRKQILSFIKYLNSKQ